jgi:polyisoprenoid-binding protein YceI
MKAYAVVCVLVPAAYGAYGSFGVPSAAQAEMARYDIDPDHSTIEFRVAHMVISKTTGHFKDYFGFIEMDPEAQTVKTIEATIKTASR